MALDPNPSASTRRIVVRALLFAAPLLISAIALPRILGSVHAVRQAAPLAAGVPQPETAELPPKPPESPTPDQIDRAADAAKALGEAERGWRKVELIAPGVPVAPGTEQTAPFQGFGLSLESDPEGATVAVDGRVLGETPLFTGFPCTPGEILRLRVSRDPLPARELTTACRADTLVKLRVRLGR
jgi:hypothetical protein